MDADGDPLVYSLSGGNDAAQFTITPAGAISFVTPPDYEAPKDANADNVYEVALAVSDGRNSTTLALRLTVENQRYRVRQLTANFVEPQRVLSVGDGSGRLYVVERRGLVWLYDPSTNLTAPTPFLDLKSEVSTDGERGLLNVIVNQQKNNIGNLLYVSVYAYFTDSSGDIVVRRYFTPSATNFEQVMPATAREFIRVPHPSNRNLGGALDLTGIGTQGGALLWVGFGDADGTAANSRAQDPTSLLGKLVVGIVSNLNEGSPLSPPPFTQINLPYPYALISSFGVRNPRYYTSQLAWTDQGVLFQEINRPGAAFNNNLGWPAYDGDTVGSGTLTTRQPSYGPPVLRYNAASADVSGSVIVGGVVYSGSIEDLNGLYVFGDAIDGRIWGIPTNVLSTSATTWPVSNTNARSLAGQFVPDRGSLTGLTSIAQAADGRLFLSTGEGGIFVVEIANP